MGNHPDHKNFRKHMKSAAAGAKSVPLLPKNVALLAERTPGVLRYFEDLEKRKKYGLD